MRKGDIVKLVDNARFISLEGLYIVETVTGEGPQDVPILRSLETGAYISTFKENVEVLITDTDETEK